MDTTRRFAELLSMGEDDFPLDKACLLIAAHARPEIDLGELLGQLDALAAEFITSFPGSGRGDLMGFLFGPGRFTGNTVEYYAADNSLLDQVIQRRLGIPISLAVVAMEVGRRVGVPLLGVGMPGHFLVRSAVDESVFYDPFHGPTVLDPDGCRRLYHAAAGQGARFSPTYLAPVSRQAIVVRILTNLKVVYQRQSDLGSLGWVMRLRASIPGIGEVERDERIRMFAILN
jgi:regulator of sirC expression with transglutaminase-like and TPR domain